MKLKMNVTIEAGETRDGKDVPREVIHIHNLMVDTGLIYVRDHGAAGLNLIKYGTGTTAAEATDTDLETSVDSEAISIAASTDDTTGSITITYHHYLGSEAGALGTITEAGLFKDTDMIARVVFAGIVKTATTYIKTVWEMQFEDGGA